jgi:PAS domain S-box-containing protein
MSLNKETFVWEVVESMEVEDLLIKQFDNSNELLMIIDGSGLILRVNKIWYYVLGYKPEEMKGVEFWKFVSDEDVERTKEAFNNKTHVQKDFNNCYVNKEGKRVPLTWDKRVTTNKNTILATAKIND